MNEQHSTYRDRQNIKRSVNSIMLKKWHFVFIFDFIKKNIKKVLTFISLIFLQSIMEVTVLILTSGSLKDKAFNAFHQGYILMIITIVFLTLVAYLAIAYYALKSERQLVLQFVNKLRRSWYIIMLSKSEQSMTNEKRADFLAKASYHFPLVSLGIDNSVLGAMRWLLSILILLIIGSIGDKYFFLIALGVICISMIISLIAYIIAKYYITQEVASYSQVIRHIDYSLSEFSLIKKFNLENSALKDLDDRVNTDTYFRIRRDIWLRYFNKVIFSILFIIAASLIIFSFYNPEIFFKFYGSDNFLLVGILSLYSFRLFYESGRTGLYIPPLMLGIQLSVPERLSNQIQIKSNKEWSFIEFRSNKIKLFNEGQYYKRVEIKIEKGKSYLYFGAAYIGKTSLAEIFSGNIKFNRNGWLVKIDEIRTEYDSWARIYCDSYFINSHFYTEKTVGEVIFGKDKQNITSENLFSVYSVAEKDPILSMIISKKRFMGESFRVFKDNNQFIFATHILHCLICKPSLIIIDNQWIDLNYCEINELIKLLKNELPESSIIIFSRNNNDIISYDEKYEIKETKIKII